MAYPDDYRFRPYVSVAARRAEALLELARMKKKGRTVTPVVIEGRKIATTFWGEAWCDNLERYSDFSNRLPRGRTYARNGSVVDLQIGQGQVSALVMGSTMYEVAVTVQPVAATRWRAVCRDCSGAIDSLVELLQGRFSQHVMARLCDRQTGLFPSPKEIAFRCSCPDWAYMCKHVAAVLYGIGARLDHQPELLFTLRKVNQQELIATAGSGSAIRRPAPVSARVLVEGNLAEMFGIDMAPASPPAPSRKGGSRKRALAAQAPPRNAELPPQPPPPAGPQSRSRKPKTRAPRRTPARLTPQARQAVSERMRQYWAERRREAMRRRRER